MSSFSPLLTDLYQLTMSRAYLNSGLAWQQATFELFIRQCPFQGEYAILAGHDLARNILENFSFSESDLNYLHSLDIFKTNSEKFWQALQQLDLKDIEIWGIPEGELIFPRLPLLQVRGPIFKAQMLESALLNAINFSTLVATCARRLRLVGKNKKLVEFGLRRAQGPNGALVATRSSYLGGFDATSNLLAGQKFQIPVTGTMAHSFIQSFQKWEEQDRFWNHQSLHELLKQVQKEDGLETHEGELAAFLNYAKTYPDNTLLLVDTYDTLKSGVPNAIRVFKILRHFHHKPLGIRLDSGDLVYFSKEARRLLDQAGFQDAPIFASNEIDEDVMESLQDQGACIDAYGIGTRLVTSAKQPALGGVYKLVQLNGQPRIKISEQIEKMILPGTKKVYRLFGKDGKMLLDLITLENEPLPQVGQEILCLHPSNPFKRAVVIPSKVVSLLQPLFQNGKWCGEPSLSQKRELSLQKMADLREDICRRQNPTPYKISVTPKLKELIDTLYHVEASPIHLE